MMSITRLQGLAMALAGASILLFAACAQIAARDGTPVPSPTPHPSATPVPEDTQTPTPETDPTETPAPSPSPTATATVAPTVAATATSTVEPTAALTPTATPVPPTPTPSPIPVSNVQYLGLFLEIEGLGDQSIVHGSSVIIRGQTSPDAILSIQGVIIPLSSDGRFEVTLQLDPGPNVIDVVSSDLDGNEESKSLEVVSLPGEGGAA